MRRRVKHNIQEVNLWGWQVQSLVFCESPFRSNNNHIISVRAISACIKPLLIYICIYLTYKIITCNLIIYYQKKKFFINTFTHQHFRILRFDICTYIKHIFPLAFTYFQWIVRSWRMHFEKILDRKNTCAPVM